MFNVKAFCECGEKMYELLLVKRVFLLKRVDGFCGIIECHVVITLSYHHIEKCPFLVPGEYPLPICQCIRFHNAIQKEIYIGDNTVFPTFFPVPFPMFLMVDDLVSGLELPEYQDFVEKEKKKIMFQGLEKFLCQGRVVLERTTFDNICFSTKEGTKEVSHI